jgi:hypothetical protein
MRKAFITLCLLLTCSLAVAVAQSQDQPQTDQQNTPFSSQTGKNVTLTGCLQPGTDPNTYMLNDVTPGDQESSQQQGYNDQGQARADFPHQNREDRTADDQSQEQNQSQSNMPSEMARTESSYMLIPEGRVDLRSHVGQRVEVSGKMIQTTSRTNQISRATTPSGQSSSMHSSTEMSGQPQFRVSSVRQISQSCQ